MDGRLKTQPNEYIEINEKYRCFPIITNNSKLSIIIKHCKLKLI